MKRIIVAMIAVCAFALSATSAAAQQTTGNIQGRIVDAQKAAIPGVTVTAKSATTGFTRTEVTDAEGVYRLTALPVGIYDVHAELSGFASVRTQGRRRQRRPDGRLQHRLEGGRRGRDRQRHGGIAADRDHDLVGRRRRRHRRASRACRSTAASSPTSRRRSRASASASTPTRPRARSSRRRSTAATAATSTTRSTAATTTTTPSAACCSCSRSRRSRSSTSSPSASRPSTAAATAA